MARRAAIWIALIAAALAVGLKIGEFLQHQKSGYFYEIRNEKDYSTAIGRIVLRNVTESVGMPLLDPGTSTIVFEEPSGLELTVYKARRIFQESYPYVDSIDVRSDRIRWDDGCYVYTLTIESSARGDRVLDPGRIRPENLTNGRDLNPGPKRAEHAVAPK